MTFQTVKHLFDSCGDCVFDFEAYLGHVVLVEAFPRPDVHLECVASVNQNNLTGSLRLVEGDDVVSQALWGAIVSSAQLPVLNGHEAGYGPGETAEGVTVVGELDHQWSYLGGGWGEVLRDVIVGNG